MRSALARKPWADLSRRRARTILSVLTLVIAVGSVGLFAVPALMDRLMRDEVAANRLADLTVVTRPLPLDREQLASLEGLPNVAAVQPQSFFATRVYVGARRAKAFLIGIPDFATQTTDVVRRTSGSAPGPDAVLTDVQNARQDRYEGRRGSVLRALAADGSLRRLRVSGEARSLNGAQAATEDRAIVLYARPETVAALSGRTGFSSLSFRLRDASRPAAERTAALVRRQLQESVPQFTGFAELPEVRPAGSWPGKQEFEDFSSFFLIVTALALLSAVVLISNTMTTLVAEQTAEIATMRAIGGRRRQVAGIYVRTALLLGALGAAFGIPLGVVIANVLVDSLAGRFYGVDGGIGVDVPVVVAGGLIAVLGTVLAALPAIRRGVRVPIREGLESAGVPAGAPGALDRLLRRVDFLPRSAQIGLRGIGRRKRRSLATAAIVAVAVGNLLAVMALGAGITQVVHEGWDDRDWQILLGSNLRRPLDARAAELIRSTPGVAGVEPVLMTDVRVGGQDAFIYGLGARTSFRYRLDEGRWYTAAEDRAGARVAVVERNLARAQGISVGDAVRTTTATGPATLRVVGIAANQQEDGTVMFVPRSTTRRLLASPDGFNANWITTDSNDHGLIDRTTTRLEDTLTENGYEVASEITYVGERDDVARYRTIITTMAVVGFLVIAISLVGLVNAITMSVVERTREIGILRSIGAREHDLRRMFATEGLALAALGWAAGVVLGWGLDRFLVWLVKEVINVEVARVYPPGNIALALVGTAVLALLVMALPLRRAARLRPGDALRYA